MNNRLINTKVAGGGGGCTDIVDNYDPFGGSGVALYQLNGDATDESGNYNGTASNVTYGTGVFGQAGVFNGSSSYVNLPTNIPITFNSFTLSAWCKVDSLPSNTSGLFEIKFGGTYPNSNEMGIYANQITGDYRFLHRNTINNEISFESLAPALGTYNHFVATYDGSTYNAYLNGVNVLSQSFSLIYSYTSLSAASLGTYGVNLYQLNGQIDQVRIFNTALDPLEVEALYTEELCICDGTVDTLDILGDGSCIATYQLDGNANDLSGNYSGTPVDVSYGVGEFDLSGVFNGSSSYIQTNYSPSYAAISQSLWFKANTVGSTNNILYFDNRGGRVDVTINSTGSNSIVNDGFELTRVNCTTATSQWNHLVLVYENWAPSYSSGAYSPTTINVTGYLNGASLGTITNKPYGQTTGMRLSRSGGSYYYDGSIDQVRIFNKALSSSEVTTLYNESACTYTPKDYITTNLALDFFSKDITAASTTWTDRANSNVLTKSGSTVYNNATGLVDFTGGYWGNDSLTETLKDASGDFTVEFYGELDNSAQYIIAGIVQSSTVRGFLFTDTTTNIEGYNYQTGTGSNSQGINYPFQSGRVHIMIQYDNSAFQKFYLNGVFVKTTTNNLNNPFWTAPNGMRLGSDRTLPSLTSSMNMGIFRIYKGLLSEQDIITNYNWAIRQF